MSKFDKKNHLWTSPEFPIVVTVGDDEIFDPTWYDEYEDESESSDSDVSDGVPDNSIEHDPFFLEAQRELQARSKNSPDGSDGSNQVSPVNRPHQSESWYNLRSRGRLPDPNNPSDISQEHVPVAPTVNVTAPNTSISTSTSNQSQQDGATVAASDTTSEQRRSRIVDFAISYLMVDDKSKLSKYLHFNFRDFKPVKLPIAAEGKRAPHYKYTENPKGFQKDLKTYMSYARKDFVAKRALIFEVYSCRSFIAIAFSGPYWSFAVCRPNCASLAWSKIRSVESEVHTTVFGKIFEAAEAEPNDPGSHSGVEELVTEYQQEGNFEIIL